MSVYRMAEWMADLKVEYLAALMADRKAESKAD